MSKVIKKSIGRMVFHSISFDEIEIKYSMMLTGFIDF